MIQTPLPLLVENSGNLEAAQRLLVHGADTSQRSRSGKDLFYTELQSGHSCCSRMVQIQTLEIRLASLYFTTKFTCPPFRRPEGCAWTTGTRNGRKLTWHTNISRTLIQVASDEQVVELLLRHGEK